MQSEKQPRCQLSIPSLLQSINRSSSLLNSYCSNLQTMMQYTSQASTIENLDLDKAEYMINCK